MQSQQTLKGIVKTTKPVTLQPFSTTTVYGFTKMEGDWMRFNLIGEPSIDSQLPNSILCTPTYCNLEPCSNRISVGLGNISANKIIIPAETVICVAHLANMVPKLYASLGQTSTKAILEDDAFRIVEKLDLGGLH